MPYTHLLRQGRIRPHNTNAGEIASLFAIIERDLVDAALAGLSVDRRFATAYNAVLQAATVVMYAEGYRSHGSGHHATTFAFLRAVPGADWEKWADYFDACRRKRNLADYVGVGYISSTEADELLKEAHAFVKAVRAWLEERLSLIHI